MQLFYTPTVEKENDEYILNETESKHAIKVLRLQKGDQINLIDGKGTFYTAKILEPNHKKCTVKITGQTSENTNKPKVHIAIAPTKNNDRLEWFIEKCTEIGIHEITPILCSHSERKALRIDRLEKMAIAAMKQSLKATLPKINEFVPLKKLIDISFEGKKYIAHCHKNDKKSLKSNYTKGENVLILIGPEGDFSEEEIALALKNDFKPVTLGDNRLRTETAGVVACHTINFMNE